MALNDRLSQELVFSPAPDNLDDSSSLCSPASASFRMNTPRRRLSLTLDLSDKQHTPLGTPDHGCKYSKGALCQEEIRSPLAEVHNWKQNRRTKVAKRSRLQRPTSLCVAAEEDEEGEEEDENVFLMPGGSCPESNHLVDSGVFVKPTGIPMSRKRSSSLLTRSYSPLSPCTTDRTLLRQIESPLGHMSLCSPTVPSPLTLSSEFTQSQGSDGYGTDLIELDMDQADDGNCPPSISSLMDAPLAVKLSAIDGGDIVQPTPQRPRTDMSGNGLRDKPVPLLFRWASMSAFDQVLREEATTGSSSQKVLSLLSPKRCSPFAPLKEAKRLPPIPWFEHAVSQSTTPTKNQELFPSPMRIDPKSPRSLSVDTPPSSSKQNSLHSLTRCMSMAELNSPDSQAEREEQLIGDESRPYCLPIVKGARPESLKCISPETLCDLMDGKYDDVVEKFTIIDARYPYEYNGGHIKNAVNIWCKEEMEKRFLTNPELPDSNGKRVILIFHCEFSSKRGPAMSHHLRKLDRNMNGISFPSLYFPELYLLHGGYKAMFSAVEAKTATARYCEPSSYLPMHDEGYKDDLRHFTKRSKSWNAGCVGREGGRKRCDLFGCSQRSRRATARAESASTELTSSQP